MHRLVPICAAAAALLVGLGCGASPPPRAPSPTTTFPSEINGHECSPVDEALQCILPPAPPKLQLAPSPFAHGVDFAWGAPSVQRMHELGAKFGASYFSYDPSKGWAQRPGLVSSYHAAGIATVGVWEATAARAGEGCGAGASDAREAARQAAAVGNTNRPIDFAIDFDASGSQVDGYFRCAHYVLGSRVGAYGGYYPLKYLCSHGLVGRTNWETYAWSASQWLPSSCAPLEQYLNGSSVDYDRAIAADYGQWPAPSKPGPTPAQTAKVHSLHAHEALRAQLHKLIERHRCRPGQHAKPRSYHSVCVYWLRKGQQAIVVINRYHREGVR
jgi:hypothetical protein